MRRLQDDSILGLYFPANSFLHGLDPRTKILALTLLVTSIFLAGAPQALIVNVALVICLASSTKVGWRVWRGYLWRFRWMLVFAFAVNFILSTEGRYIAFFGVELPLTWSGLCRALTITIQIAAVFVIALVFTLTTSPPRVAQAIRAMLAPADRLGIRTEDLGWLILLSLRFLPIVQLELKDAVDAQRARGVDFAVGTAIDRARAVGGVLSLALAGTLRRANTLGVAMTARGFSPGRPRSEYRPLELRIPDLFTMIAACAVLLITLLTPG